MAGSKTDETEINLQGLLLIICCSLSQQPQQPEKQQQQQPSSQDVGGTSAAADIETVIKHPLQNSWTLWFIGNYKKKDYMPNIEEISTFESLEDFWSLYNHTKMPSELKPGCDYCLFKKGIKPMWEDEANKRGGKWVVNLEKNQRDELDNVWLEVEAFGENGEEVCGALVNIRQKGNKICIWTADAEKSKEAIIMKIGAKLKERLNIDKTQIGYQTHKDTVLRQSINKITYYL